jgi:hypothetical protein
LKTRLLIALLTIGLTSWTKVLNAQWIDSTWVSNIDSNSIIYYYPQHAFSARDTFLLDTTLYYFQRYDARVLDYDMAAGTMTIGGPIKDLYFGQSTPQFTIGEHSLGTYFYNSENMPRYGNVRVPYSEIFYTIAGQEENYLKGRLANQASPRLYFGLNFNVESTQGLFYNQRAGNVHFQGLAAFETTDKRYGLEVEYIHNKFKLGENGGLTDDTYYEDSTQLQRQVLDVNLLSATNIVKSHQFTLNQHLNIGRSGTDSTDHRFVGKAYFNTKYNKRGRRYTDEGWNDSYYQNAYIDTLVSVDTSAFTDLQFDFGLSNFYPNRHQYFTFDVGAAYNYKMYFNGNEEFYFNYLSPHADVVFDFYKVILEGGFKYQIKVATDHTFDIGANDFNFYGKLKFPLLKYLVWDVGIKTDLQSPQIRAYNTYSNHYMWVNSFDKQKTLELNSHLNYKGYQLEGAVHTLNDYVYFDANGPMQYGGSFQVISAKLKKRFAFGKFGSTLMAMYQKSSNTDVIHLPDFVGKANIYFAFPLFKRALIINPGFNFTYLSSYYGDGYNPALMQFYWQDQVKLEEQFYFDFYINIKIKRARVFVKYQNLGSLLGNYNYFLVPHYPQQDGIFKIGLSWRFFD